MSTDTVYDVVVVGAGFAGAIIAKELAARGRSVLLLESGTDSTLSPEGYRQHVETFLASGMTVPNAGYPRNPNSPQADVLDVPLDGVTYPITQGYLVQYGPMPFSSDNTRYLGGTSLHWLGESLRQLPSDFQTRTLFEQGVDWPIGYDDLVNDYARAEAELGVAAEVTEMNIHGIWFPPGYVFPMQRTPFSYSDDYLRSRLTGQTISLDGASYPADIIGTPVARNSDPNPLYQPGEYLPAGMAGNPFLGQRCQGNSACVPICPVQAKYNSLKTLDRADKNYLTIQSQSVANQVLVDPDTRQINGIQYLRYVSPDSPSATTGVAVGRLYVLACSAIENAKLLLLSNAANSSDQVGRNLMDHPYPLNWALLQDHVGTFRGPGSSAGIDSLRDGPFRSSRAAFRITIGNWGWQFAAGSPTSDVRAFVTPTASGAGLVSRFGRVPRHRTAPHLPPRHVDHPGGCLPGAGIFGRSLRASVADRVNRQCQLGFLVEQMPDRNNRVTLSSYVDQLGIPRPQIAYDLSDYTRQGIVAARQAAQQIFSLAGALDQTVYDPDDPHAFRGEDGTLYSWRGAGHIVGTHRMGGDSASSVTDANGLAWDHPNLYVVGAGSMPTTGTSNPTLTLAALAFRTSRALDQALSSRST